MAPEIKTPCKERPELCQPRRIKLVAFDADDTIWKISPYGIASSVRGPFHKVDEDTIETIEEPPRYYYEEPKPKPKPVKPPKKIVFTPRMFEEEEEEELREIAEELMKPEVPKLSPPKWEREFLLPPKPKKVTIKLVPGLRDTLDKLDKKGIAKTIISLNTPGSVKAIIEAFGLTDKFTKIADTWESKGKVFSQQTKDLGVNPCDALFVDNMQSHVKEVVDRCGIGLVYGKDIKHIAELLRFIEE